MKILKIQQKKQPGGKLPRPVFIYEHGKKKGKVLEQKFWKGNPSKLVGFSQVPEPGDMQIMLNRFFFNTKAAIGMYPVFEKKDGKWFTSQDTVESVERVRKGKKK